MAPKGHVIASDQLALTALVRPGVATDKVLKAEATAESWQVKGKDFVLLFDKNGALSSYKWKGREQLKAPLMPHFTRALTDNDKRGWKADKKLRQWFEQIPKIEYLKINEGNATVTSYYTLINDSAKVKIDYTVQSNGVVQVDYSLEVKPGLPDIPRVGMQLGIDRGYDQVQWYGKGLYENYTDRRWGFDAGLYSQPIEEFMEPYVVPQENGNRTDVRWMYLHNKKGKGLLVVADSLLSMSAWPYTEANIRAARHTYRLRDAGYLTLNIDLVQMGVGGNDSWSDVAAPLAQYRVPAKNYQYRFYLLPLDAAKPAPGTKARAVKGIK